MSDQVIEQQPNPLAAIIHETWKEEMRACPHGIHLGGPHAGEPYAMCEVFASAIMPHLFHQLIPQLIRAWADAWDEVANADPDDMAWVQDDPDGIKDPESFESHIARHIADDMEGLIVIPQDLDDWQPRFDDHPLPPLPDGGL